MSAVVTKSGSNVTSTTTFSAQVPTTFMNVIGKTAMTVTGTSNAITNMPLYIDFYLLLDNSPSMGVGATPSDVATMVNNTPDACAFACHDLNDNNNYYKLAKTLGVTTRIDVLRTATQQLMDTAAATQTYSNQFRMAIYDFGGSAQSAGLRSLFSLSSSLTSAKTAAGNIDLMTVNGQNDNNDQDTGYTDVFPAINSAISAPGAGTSSAPQKYLFFVSDGVADENNRRILPQADDRRTLPVSDQSGAVHDHQEPRHQDRGAVHDLSRAADQRLVQYLDRAVQPRALWSVSEQRNRAEHAKLRIPRALFRSQPDPGHFAGDEHAVSKSGRRRPHQQLARRHPRALQPSS